MLRWISLLLLVACGTDNWDQEVKSKTLSVADGVTFVQVYNQDLGSPYALVTVMCPENHVVVSGGCECSDYDSLLASSHMRAEWDGWVCRCSKTGLVTASAICVEAQ